MKKKIAILNGPNLNLLGAREQEIYGSVTLEDIKSSCTALAKELNFEVAFMQSNHEGDMVDAIQHSSSSCAGIIINAAAYTHTSIAIHDALKAAHIPIIEVHLSNIFAREEFRHNSYVSPVAKGIICGFGEGSYLLAINAICRLIGQQ